MKEKFGVGEHVKKALLPGDNRLLKQSEETNMALLRNLEGPRGPEDLTKTISPWDAIHSVQ